VLGVEVEVVRVFFDIDAAAEMQKKMKSGVISSAVVPSVLL